MKDGQNSACEHDRQTAERLIREFETGEGRPMPSRRFNYLYWITQNPSRRQLAFITERDDDDSQFNVDRLTVVVR